MLRHLFKKLLLIFLVINIPVHAGAAQELFCRPMALDSDTISDRADAWEDVLHTMKLKRYGVYSVAAVGAGAGIYYTFFHKPAKPAEKPKQPAHAAAGTTYSDEDVAKALHELKGLSGWEGLKYEAGRSFLLALAGGLALTVAQKMSPAFDTVTTTFLNQCGFAPDLLVKQCSARAIDQSMRLNRNIKVAQTMLAKLDVQASTATMLTNIIADDLYLDIVSQLRASEELFACFYAHADLGLIDAASLQDCQQQADNVQQLINQSAAQVALVASKIRTLDSTMIAALNELNVLHDACLYATIRFAEVFMQAAYGA